MSDQNQPAPDPMNYDPNADRANPGGENWQGNITDSPQPGTWGQDGAVEAEELKGQALDDALEAAGLPKSGTADEKRRRLADHQSGDATP
jgi:hypothetical protein